MEVVVRTLKDVTIVDLHGRLDAAARWNFKAIMNQCCVTEEHYLVLNFNHLTYIDSAGLGFMVLAFVKFTGMNRLMSWVEPRAQVKVLLESLNMAAMVPIYESEADALEAVLAS